MLCSYKDITSKIKEAPTWYDEHGVPRYCDMHPDNVADIYADEVLFYIITCQQCGTPFYVAASSNKFGRYQVFHNRTGGEGEYVESEYNIEGCLDDIVNKVGYGDPPCWECSAGSTMSSNTMGGISFWKKDTHHDWVRVPLPPQKNTYEIP